MKKFEGIVLSLALIFASYSCSAHAGAMISPTEQWFLTFSWVFGIGGVIMSIVAVCRYLYDTYN